MSAGCWQHINDIIIFTNSLELAQQELNANLPPIIFYQKKREKICSYLLQQLKIHTSLPVNWLMQSDATILPTALRDLASLFLAQTLITSLIIWLHLSSIFYCVDCLYKGDDNPAEAKLVQEMFNQLPGAVFRIFLTFLQLSF
jgi:hypothetical protein